jgi:phosphate starvation-inducible PhoH-like protein
MTPVCSGRIFKLLNISDEDARTRFGFFLEALEYGTPPHGGIALGLDRVVAILSAESSYSRSDRLPEDGGGRGSDVRRPVPGRSAAASGAAHPAHAHMKKIAVSQEGIETLYGPHDANLKHIESLMDVEIRTQGDELIVEGSRSSEQRVEKLFDQLAQLRDSGYELTSADVKTAAELVVDDPNVDLRDYFSKDGPSGRPAQSAKRRVNPKSPNQKKYLELIEQNDIVLGVGPAGTGKTYLAMAQAVSYLLAKKVSRIILARPAVEAGEKLGFLPGDLQEKVNPYLRPLYDALYDMMDTDKASRLVERGTIEVAPLAFMRGRTLNDAFVILDEAQNTTSEQMKMFLTRLGFGSKAVVTGDITQIDLPNPKLSGLVEALKIVREIDGIGIIYFDEKDVVRHKLVQQIVKAYDAYSTPRAKDQAS